MAEWSFDTPPPTSSTATSSFVSRLHFRFSAGTAKMADNVYDTTYRTSRDDSLTHSHSTQQPCTINSTLYEVEIVDVYVTRSLYLYGEIYKFFDSFCTTYACKQNNNKLFSD